MIRGDPGSFMDGLIHPVQLLRHPVHDRAGQRGRREIVLADVADASAKSRIDSGAAECSDRHHRILHSRSFVGKPSQDIVQRLVPCPDLGCKGTEELLQDRIRSSAAQGRACQQVSSRYKRSCLDPGRGKVLVGQDRDLSAGSHVDKNRIRREAGRSKEACLVVSKGHGDRSSTELTKLREVLPHLRQHAQIAAHAHLLEGICHIAGFLPIEQPGTLRDAGMHQRSLSSCQLHPQIVADGTEADCILRDQSMPAVVDMRHQSIAAGGPDPAHVADLLDHAATAVFFQVSSAVLPGVQRTDAVSVLIKIQDAVHLTGKPYGLDILIGIHHLICNCKSLLHDAFHILDPLPFISAVDEALICNCLRIAHRSVFTVQHGRADRCCSDIQSQCFHVKASLFFSRLFRLSILLRKRLQLSPIYLNIYFVLRQPFSDYSLRLHHIEIFLIRFIS